MSGCEDEVDKIMASLVHHEDNEKMNRYPSPDGTRCQSRGDNETVNGWRRGECKKEIQFWVNNDYNNNNHHHTRKTL